AEYYLKLFAAKTNPPVNYMSEDFSDVLLHYDWKGNVRELKNIMERAVILAEGSELKKDDLPVELQLAANIPTGKNKWDLAFVEQQHIQKVLLFAKGNKTEAARLLNIGLTTLYRKLEEYKITL
ncbi:MAG: sigma-54-dependent Fis family transcriptional regulator, partial [Bacteroidetes bacterium]|nr:sigma-54-dependent Fis family transcriptional regulator [Bacteroidota bacterium]